MCYFEIPRLLFYTHIPALVISLFLGFFVFFENKKSPINRNLAIFIFFLSFWLFIDTMEWLTFDNGLAYFLTKISPLTSFSLIFFLYFSYAFRSVHLTLAKKIIYSIPFWPILFLLPTEYNAYIIDSSTCDYQYGILLWYIYLIIFIFMVWSAIILLSGREKIYDDKIRKQIKIIVGAMIFIVIWFAVLDFFYNSWIFPANWYDNMLLTLPVGIVLFISLVVYAITRYEMLNIKLFGAQVLVIALVALIGSQFFFIQNPVNIILTGVTLLLSIGFGWMLIYSVRTDIKRKEDLEILSNKLAAANDKLHMLDKAKSDFISIASHQLRTPLTAIKGFVSLLLEGTYGSLNLNQRPALEKIYISNERLVQLVEDLLNISRMDAGKMEFDFQPAAIEDLVNEAVMTLELSAKAKELYLDWKKPTEKIPELKMDITKIKEVISNMIDNAIKYTQRGGVTVRLEKGSYFSEKDREQKNVVRVIVSDTGIGMEQEDIDMIFNKFQRGRGSSHYHTDGTGLGMYIGKKVVEAHHGRIWAESPGKKMGSKFILELPVV
jgi:signal transduction histidine kinase